MLLIGYGNPGRGDDGLGPALAERIAARAVADVQVEIDYQLTVDHALLVRSCDRVVFADAQIGLDRPFHFSPVAAAGGPDLGSHTVTPGGVLALAGTLYGAWPEAHVIGIAGHAFGEVREGLSAEAARNLAMAEAFLAERLSEWASAGTGAAHPA